MIKWLLIGFILSACGVLQDGRGGATVYVGLGQDKEAYRIPEDSDLISLQTEIIGFWIDRDHSDRIQGGGFGYRARDVIVASPGCQVVFIVEGRAQVQQAVELTRDLLDQGENLCIVED